LIYAIPFALQAVVMLVDEIYCHRRRTLRLWERIGHPLDTLTFVVCLGWLYFAPKTGHSLTVYVILALFSCLFITKDEWEHHDLTSGFENWLHSLLFILHPLVLIWAAGLWQLQIYWPIEWFLPAAALFMIYQALYWNLWKRNDQ
jgi:hypothetical protein